MAVEDCYALTIIVTFTTLLCIYMSSLTPPTLSNTAVMLHFGRVLLPPLDNMSKKGEVQCHHSSQLFCFGFDDILFLGAFNSSLLYSLDE